MTRFSQKTTDSFSSLAINETLQGLASDQNQGLTQREANKRLAEFGPNTIASKEVSLWRRIASRFWGPIPWMIEIAAILSALVGKWEDLLIIVSLLFINATLDFFQEHRALNALKALQQTCKQTVHVLRDGHFLPLDATKLVPGDIIRLKIGDMVPADVQLLSGDFLSIDESTLTGESLPVSKQSQDVAYANTIVRQGEMQAIVVNTGSRTRFNAVVNLVAEASVGERSHFQRMVMEIGHFLIIISVTLVGLILVVGLLRHEDFIELARFSMVLTVAAIPVALPAVLSVTMAVGALNLSRRKAIVTRLTAIEELAGVDVFCSDKTGTLTKNEMQVATPVVLKGYSEEELISTAVLASRRENDDPIETPLFQYLDSHYPDHAAQKWQLKHFEPFDPIKKYTAARLEKDGETITVMKGAPQVIIAQSHLTDDEKTALNHAIEAFAVKGYRTLAVSKQSTDGVTRLLGLIPLIDPPREDSYDVIQKMTQAGVNVKMLTGDNIAIAHEIGGLLGLTKKTVRSSQIKGKSDAGIKELANALTQAIYQRLHPELSVQDASDFAASVMNDIEENYDISGLETEFVHTHESAIISRIESVDIFAEVLPEDKYFIVDTLQKADHIVGMTGDGVNDAPALRKADCGFAVANATDAARSAADIILTQPGLSVINDAIEQARFTFERMKSYATFRIAETIRIILFMTLSIILFEFYPLTALMVILLALLNDLPILAIAYDNTEHDNKPVRWHAKSLFTIASVLGVSGVITSFLLYILLREHGFDQGTIQTLLFLKLLIAGHSTIFVTRNNGWFWNKPWPSPLLLTAILGTEIIGTLIAVNGVFVTAISWQLAGFVWLYAVAEFVFNNGVKNILLKTHRAE